MVPRKNYKIFTVYELFRPNLYLQFLCVFICVWIQYCGFGAANYVQVFEISSLAPEPVLGAFRKKTGPSRYISGDSMSSLLWFWHADNISNYACFLPPFSFPLPLPSSLPFSMPVLGGCQILTLEAPLITKKTPCMYNGYIYICIAKTTSALLL
jgi:hypothetical protein